MDLKGKSLGRAATEAALLLRGKKQASFSPNIVPKITLEIKNVGELTIDEKKMEQKFYKRYSGYPSGLKKTKLGVLFGHSPQKVFLKAIKGMLPKNKLRDKFLKNVVFLPDEK